MRNEKRPNRSRLIQAAMGSIPCDLTVENVQFVNMFTGEIYPAAVDVLDGRVVRVRMPGDENPLPAKRTHDGQGAYLLPGLIDTHMHVESTMMIPENLSRAVVPWGTTTVCADPHEIANVTGVAGVAFMLENARRSALRQYNLVPSCVPSVPAFESSGAEFGPAQAAELLELPDVVGIAEIMDMAGVYGDDARMHDIIDEGLSRGAFLQGHAPGLTGRELAAYLLGGPKSDHESYTADDVREKLRNGMHINLRASSITNTLKDLLPGLGGMRWTDLVSVCTDDIYAKDILQNGHLSGVVKKMLACGVEPIEAYRMATYNAAREYGFDDLGVLAPGYLADMQLLRSLDGGRPEAVFIGGALVAKQGRYLPQDDPSPLPPFPNTVHIPHITSPGDFLLRAPAGCGDAVAVNVIRRLGDAWHVNELVTRQLPVKDGYVDLSGDPNLIFVCVTGRHGNGGKTIAVYENFGLERGALGYTMSHDSHNLTIAYHDPADACAAAMALQESGGGMCLVEKGEVNALLALPVAGLMSPLPCEELVAEIDALDAAYRQMRSDSFSVMRCTTLSLPCVPRFVITNKGLVDGRTQQFAELFPATSAG